MSSSSPSSSVDSVDSVAAVAGVERAVCRYPARAWCGDVLVAESTAAVRVDEPDQAPMLCFPVADVRFDLFAEAGRGPVSPATGEATLWDLTPDPPRWGSVLRTFAADAPSTAWLAGLASFDPDRVRIEIVDGAADDPARDRTAKRFPTWGDASDLIDILAVRPDGDGRYVSVVRGTHRRPVVEGSQMLGQAIVAAGRHAPGRRLVSGSMVFLRAADSRRPLRFELDELSAGRTLTTLAVHVRQDERLCASGILLLDVTAPTVIRHGAAPPATPGPGASEPYDMAVTGRDIRIVDGAYTGSADAPVGPPVLDAWVRFRDVPEDPYLHAGLLAQFTGHLSIAAALRPHEGVGQEQAHRTLSTAINAIGISLHGEVRADRWMLYRHLSTFAGDGMTHAECRVHDEAGDLLASFTVDAMVRPLVSSAVGEGRSRL